MGIVSVFAVSDAITVGIVSVELRVGDWIALLDAQADKSPTSRRTKKRAGILKKLILPLQLEIADGNGIAFLYACLAQSFLHAKSSHDLLEAAH